MSQYLQSNLSPRRIQLAAIGLLLTLGATWLWAHAGHAPLPTKGAQLDAATGVLTLSSQARDVLDVQSEEVEPRVVEETILAYATLVSPWRQHVFISSRLPGRVGNLFVKPGEKVEAGQALAEVQSLELEDLQLQLLNTQSANALSLKILDELKPLAAQGAIPEKEYREALSKHKQHESAFDVSRATWLSTGLTDEGLRKLLAERKTAPLHLPIQSPFSGTVMHVDISVGQVVEPTDHLFEIVDLSSVWVKIAVLEKDLSKVQTGQSAELTLAGFPTDVIKSSIDVKSLYLDPQTHLGVAWAELKNQDGQEPRFLPGMNGQARLVVSSQDPVLAIPTSAVIAEGAERYVLTENSKTVKTSEYQKRSIVTGGQTSKWTQIKEGEVYAGDRVITTGLPQLSSFFPSGVLKPTPEAKKNMGLVVEPALPHVVENVLRIQGAVDLPPNGRAFAASQLPGKIETINVERNQTVRKGDVLATIASLDLQKLQLDLLQAHLQLELLAETLKMLRSVDNIVSRRQLWEGESLYNDTLYRRDSLKRKLANVGLSDEQIEEILKQRQLVDAVPVRAPSDGVVVHFDKALGQVIKSQEPLFEIHDLSHGYVRGFLSERELPLVRLGQKARVRLISDPSFVGEGTVVRSGQMFGREDRVLSVWVELNPNSSKFLQANLSADLSLVVGDAPPALAVSLNAIFNEGARSYVFVQNADGSFDRRLVSTGRNDDRYIEILNGLQPGELVAMQGTNFLQTAFAGIR